jgi:hypothetical protein
MQAARFRDQPSHVREIHAANAWGEVGIVTELARHQIAVIDAIAVSSSTSSGYRGQWRSDQLLNSSTTVDTSVSPSLPRAGKWIAASGQEDRQGPKPPRPRTANGGGVVVELGRVGIGRTQIAGLVGCFRWCWCCWRPRDAKLGIDTTQYSLLSLMDGTGERNGGAEG